MASKEIPTSKSVEAGVLYLRIDPDVRLKLRSWTKESKKSETEIVETLLNYFFEDLSDSDRETIVGHRRLPGIGAVLEAYAWAEHAFTRCRWTRAVESYQQVETLAGRDEGLLRLAHYKQAFAWAEIGIASRNRALTSSDRKEGDRLYREALDALALAIALNSVDCEIDAETDDSEGGRKFFSTNRILMNNLASCYALLAQCSVESAVIQRDPKQTKWAGAIDKLRDSANEWFETASPTWTDVIEPMNAAWEFIGKQWRKMFENESKKVQLIDKCGRTAMNCLRHAAKDSETMTPSDPRILFELSDDKQDTDLAFLRWDSEMCDEFNTWRDDLKYKTKSDEDIDRLAKRSSEVVLRRFRQIREPEA